MKGNELVDFIEKFYLDIIGIVVPGAFFMFLFLSVCPFHECVSFFLNFAKSNTAIFAFAFLVASVVIGHILKTVGGYLFLPLFCGLCKLFKKNIPHVIPSAAVCHSELIEQLQKRIEVIEFRRVFSEALKHDLGVANISTEDFHSLRNIALSVKPESNQLVYKFMYTSLMYLGIATGLLLNYPFIIARITPFCSFLDLLGFSLAWVILCSVLLFEHFESHRRAMYVPFSSALITLVFGKKDVSQ